MLQIHLVTLFPEFYTSPLNCGLMQKAREAGIIDFSFHNPRTYSLDRHHHVDDAPYGGGPGMLMQIEPLAKCLAAIERPGPIICLTPRGKPLTQKMVREWASEDDLTFICARYEGLDERLFDLFPCESVAVTDAVLNSGDSAALVAIEACARLRPGFMGKDYSSCEESFSCDLLEYPQYTRPAEFEGLSVPEVLLSGNHKEIALWRRQKSLETTLKFRPDLLDRAPINFADATYLDSLLRKRLARNLSFCLVHHPVKIEGQIGTSSLTNLDIHDIARVSASYGLGPFFVVTPLADQLTILENILQHWTKGLAAQRHPDRAYALSHVRPAKSLEEALSLATSELGIRPTGILSSASWPKKPKLPLVSAGEVKEILAKSPVMVLLGTAQGLADEALDYCAAQMRPVRFLGFNHLSVRSAAAILADRIVGDFN